MVSVFIYARKSGNNISVDLETFLVLNIYNICDSNEVTLNITEKDILNESYLTIDLKNVKNYKITSTDSTPDSTVHCQWPVLLNGNTVISGLCSVCRQIIKSTKNNDIIKLLGFRDACLVACNGNSIWTKFCEIDLPMTVTSLLSLDRNLDNIPDNLVRFEYHLEQPVKMHNIYKIAREVNNDKDLKSGLPTNLHHTFAESTNAYLSDLLLFPCVQILFALLKPNLHILNDLLPLTFLWLESVTNLKYNFLDFTCNYKPITISNLKLSDKIPRQSLYSSDPNRYNPTNRIYTKQSDIDQVLAKIRDLDIIIPELGTPYGSELDFCWDNIPVYVNPNGGSLPLKRSARKCQQLENLTKAVLKMTSVHRNIKVIVDFCSGSGHLGLLLAYLLPKCQVILVENKERSLDRARNTIGNLKLTNVTLVQCNLDYFHGKFDLGIALHACGVATDLVLQSCYKNRAHFICCPCCYGGIHNTYHLTYPRSSQFRNLLYSEYLNIAHASDQTHGKGDVKTEQGYVCMTLVDLDRKFEAIDRGYVVHLGKLQPETCTPKNNLLVGFFNN